MRGLELQSIPLLKGFNVEDVPDIIEFIYKGNTSTWNLGPTLEKIGPKILKLFLAPMGETRLSHDNILKFSLGPSKVTRGQ